MSFIFRDRAVFHAFRNDKYFAWAEGDISISHLYGDVPLENQEEVVRFIVLVPNEWPFDLDDHEIVTVELADSSGLEVLCKQSELLGEVDAPHGYGVLSLQEVCVATVVEIGLASVCAGVSAS